VEELQERFGEGAAAYNGGDLTKAIQVFTGIVVSIRIRRRAGHSEDYPLCSIHGCQSTGR
jgi:hypothetical protein